MPGNVFDQVVSAARAQGVTEVEAIIASGNQALTRFAHDYGAHEHEDIVQELRRHSSDRDPFPIRRIADQIPTVQPAPSRPDRQDVRSDDGRSDDGPTSPKGSGSG